MHWTAVIPLRGRGERKTRLADRFSLEERHRLSEAMFEHVTSVLAACPGIGQIALLSDLIRGDWAGVHIPDAGRGLNTEIGMTAELVAPSPLLVIHADLPLLSAVDVNFLLAAAEGGVALAPDRHGTGTNAIALGSARSFRFAFGPGSLERHLDMAGNHGRIITRQGIAVDFDTPEDYDVARALGAQMPV